MTEKPKCPFCGSKENIIPSGYWIKSGNKKRFQITVGSERVYECKVCNNKWPPKSGNQNG